MTRNVCGELSNLGPPPSPAAALAVLAPPVSAWFCETFAKPTAAQRLAWPAIAEGQHLLLSSPTGTGKTLAALLPIISRLLTEPPGDGTRCLILTPLKALANDFRKNLRAHLHGLRAFLPTNAPALRVGLRTGDTSSRVRQALRREPPAFLVTTPESLAVLLSQPSAGELFAALRWVIVDEVHTLAPNKRGADLALSLERLTEMAIAPLQRIGLSATCAPLSEVAHFLAGTGRPCSIASVAESAALELRVEPLEETGGFLAQLLVRLEPELHANRTTLIFTNTRGLAERVAWALLRRFPAWAEHIAVHHSAVAAVQRRLVERRLKQGQLRVVVSSTSLELGIDIGAIDGVVLVHPPGGVVRLLQRVGRGGHGPGRCRRGLVLTATAGELLEATATGASSRPAQYEPLRMPRYPLDVLCQQLLGMAAERPWTADEAFALVGQAHPYVQLPRSDFDDCLAYLCGRHRTGEDWLPARLSWNGAVFELVDHRTARLLRRNLGTILSEETRRVRLHDGPAVGEVEDGFADRLRPGDRFLLGGRCLEYRRTESRALLVEEVLGRPVVPRWSGNGWPLSRELARRLYLLRVQAAEALRDGPQVLAGLLRRDYGLHEDAITRLVAFFLAQECVSEIPEVDVCLVESVPSEYGTGLYIHTPLNRAGNEVLARLAVLRLARDEGRAASSVVADLGFALFFGASAERRTCLESPSPPKRGRGELRTPELVRALLRMGDFDLDLAEALTNSELLRERFHCVALTGLMLLRNPLGGRRRVGGRDWAERRLFEQVRRAEPDFVLLRQALHEVCDECCDAVAARAYLEQLPQQMLRCRPLPRVSPFAESWSQVGAGPAESVDSPAEALQRLHATLTGDEAHAGA
jgi:ATP-dependent Lhr-like helicase